MFLCEYVIIVLNTRLVVFRLYFIFIVDESAIIFIVLESDGHISGSDDMEQHFALSQAFIRLNLSLLDLRLQFPLESKQVGNELIDVFTLLDLRLTNDRSVWHLLVCRNTLLGDLATLVYVIKDLLSSLQSLCIEHASRESISGTVADILVLLLLLFLSEVCLESLLSMHLFKPVNVILSDITIDKL